MSSTSYPFGVRLIGFSDQEREDVADIFADHSGKGYEFRVRMRENLLEPDFFLVNAENLRALATLSNIGPSEVHPALLVGSTRLQLPYPSIPRPIDAKQLLAALGHMVEHRADALARLDAAGAVSVTERRRGERVDIDFTDPAVYLKMRAEIPTGGGLLMVDKNRAYQAHLADVFKRYALNVVWANDMRAAAKLCADLPIAMVLINTSTPDIDPYQLCAQIKTSTRFPRTVVAFLVGDSSTFDSARAQAAGVDGLLEKPIAHHHLISTVKRFVPLNKAAAT